MNCDTARLYLTAEVDGELDVEGTLRLEEHVAECATCRALRRENEALRSALGRGELRYEAPKGLEKKVRRALQAQSGSGGGDEARWRARWWWAMSAAAAVLLLCAGAGWVVWRHGNGDVAGEILASHIRSLQVGHLTDVISTDRHTVKPWFQGKLDFAPTVPDGPGTDWTLVGGRLDYIGGRAVAALVYTWRKHVVNVFVWPGTDGRGEETKQGYHLLHFARDGMTWWVVSDASEADLRAAWRE